MIVPVVVIGPPVKVIPFTVPDVATFVTVPVPPEPVATVIGKVVPFPFVNVIVFEDTDAVTILFPTNEAVVANELDKADVAKELLNALVAKDAVPNNEPVIPAVTFKDPVIAEDPVILIDPVNIKVSIFEVNSVPVLPVTVKLPLIVVLPDTIKEPVICELSNAMRPLRATNSFAIFYALVHYP